MNLFWFLRAKRWAQNPPSLKRVLFMLGIVGFCLAVYLIEQLLGGGSAEGLNFNWRRPGF